MKKQAGFGLVLIIVAVVVIAMIAGGAYLYLAKQGKAPAPAAVSNTLTSLTLNPNCSYHDPNLCKFINRQEKPVYPMQVSTSYTLSGQQYDSQFLVDSQQNFQSISSIGGKESTNVIILGDTKYTKDYNGNFWWKQSDPSTLQQTKQDFTDNLNQATSSAKATDKTTFTPEGKTACGQLSCYKYKVTDSSTSQSGDLFILFDDQQYLTRQMIASQTNQGKTTNMTINYSYPTAGLKAPSPTKDATPDQILPSSTTNPAAMPSITPSITGLSPEQLQQLQQAAQQLQSQYPTQ